MKPSISRKVTEFFSQYPSRTYARGEMVLFADGSIPPIMFITKGRIAQYDITGNGNKVILNVFKYPAFFPIVNAINKTPNVYFYEAVTPVEVYTAPANKAIRFLQDNPDVTFDLLARLYSGMSGLLGKMTQLMSGTARARLLFDLTIAAERFGELREDGTVLVRITESHLAQQTGLARETVSRELQKLIKQKIVQKGKGGIILKIPAPIV